MAIAPWIVGGGESERFPVRTRANVGEVFPDPVGPLSFTTIMYEGAELGWRDAFVKIGAFDFEEFNPDGFEVLGVFGGYCYLNASVFRVFGERTPGLSAQIMDDLFFGNQPGVEPYTPMDGDTSARHTAAITQTLGWVLTTERLDEIALDQEWVDGWQSRRPDFASMSNEDLWAYAERAVLEGVDGIHSFRYFFMQHLWITMLSSVPPGVLGQICTAVGRPADAMRLMAGLGDVESAAPSYALWQLGRQVRASASLMKAFDGGVDGLLARLHDMADSGDVDAKAFEANWAAFIAGSGARGPNEWEMRMQVWETKPELPLAAVERMRIAPDQADPSLGNAERAAERERVRDEIATMLAGDPQTQATFLGACRAAVLFNQGRERTKTNNIRLVHEGARLPLMTIARRMLAAGHLQEVGDFGLLKRDEFRDWLADPESFRTTLDERRALYRTYEELQEPFVFARVQPWPDTWPKRGANTVEIVKPGEVLNGVPGCPGVVRGIARVVLDPLDPSDFEPGEILIAPLTDPSWTPLFVPASGVVVNVGAPQSHAVIVSRELGIPCVPSVTDATRRIPNGTLIELDGDAGTVTVLDVPA